ncbi:MAG: hypothetical protein ACOCRK_01615 [bacterium]
MTMTKKHEQLLTNLKENENLLIKKSQNDFIISLKDIDLEGVYMVLKDGEEVLILSSNISDLKMVAIINKYAGDNVTELPINVIAS